VNHLKYLAECLHDKEQQLTRDFAKQTTVLNAQLKELTQKFATNQDQMTIRDDQLDQTKKELLEKALLNKRLTAENEELTLSLLAAQETQRELAQELSDLRDRYGEISAMLNESRMELKRSSDGVSHRGSTLGFYSPGFAGDCLASEIEDATFNQSDQGYDSFFSSNSPRHNIIPRKPNDKISQLIFDNHDCGEASTTSTQYANLCKLDNNIDSTLNNLQDTELIVVTEHLILKNSPEMGVPGVPGSKDLDNALKRLSLRKKVENDYQNFKTERRRSSEVTVIRRQTCSYLPHFAGHNSKKLLLLKPLQGSETLAHWRHLAATPTFDAPPSENSANGVRVKAEFPILDRSVLHSRYYS
uniref:Trafficking kinesin-binding protein C-terminal domain-containing protein n=1 Tax=Romanomermis culicivorax TaxID=13658 RepID=A0A915JU01_ROMCU